MRGVLAAVIGLVCAPVAVAQPADIPRTASGRPDFHGVWESRWLTPMERPNGTTAETVSGEDAKAFAAARWAGFFEGDGALHPEDDFDFAGLLPAGDGSFRTSLIVEPSSGKRPQSQLSKDLTPKARDIRKAAENPEGLSNDERCLSANGRAPLGVSPGSMYRQIVQTDAHIVIYTEDQMVTRVIGIDAAPRPAGLLSLAGDSVATWDGDTLLVVTTQIRPPLPLPGVPPYEHGRRVTERFTLTTPDAISYDYVLEDSAMLTGPLRVNYTMTRTNHAMFESACHEGNYSIPGMMLGARVLEAPGNGEAAQVISEEVNRSRGHAVHDLFSRAPQLKRLPASAKSAVPTRRCSRGRAITRTDGITMIRASIISVALAFACEAAVAQSSSGSELKPPPPVPRTAEGRPDFSGNWATAFITSTGRMDGAKSLVATDAEAAKLSHDFVAWAHSEAAGAVIDPDFFAAGVTKLARVNGQWRTSLITTGDGAQAYTAEGKRLDAERRALNQKQVDDPEMRPLFERCLVGVGSAPLTGVPSLMVRQFVQTPDHLVISTDGNDVRIIGLGALPRPAAVVAPLGDSSAHWEGDTLAVHTTALQGQVHRQIITRPESRVIERFEMLNGNELFYRFTVEDTEIYEKPWSAELVLTRTDQSVMEYACHEGNISMVNMLLAGREADKRAAQQAGTTSSKRRAG